MDDNSLNPPKLLDATADLKTVLDIDKKLEEKFRTKDLINIIVGKETAVTKSYKLESHKLFGTGKDKPENYWKTIIRQATVQNLQKDIETYGNLKLTEKGQQLLDGKWRGKFMIAEDRQYDLAQSRSESDSTQTHSGGLDDVLFAQLKEPPQEAKTGHPALYRFYGSGVWKI